MTTERLPIPVVDSVTFRPYLGPNSEAFVPVFISDHVGIELDLVLVRTRQDGEWGWTIKGDTRCGWFRNAIEAMVSYCDVSIRIATGDHDDLCVVDCQYLRSLQDSAT